MVVERVGQILLGHDESGPVWGLKLLVGPRWPGMEFSQRFQFRFMTEIRVLLVVRACFVGCVFDIIETLAFGIALVSHLILMRLKLRFQ